LNYHE
jgi:quinol monooxygenase YgiN